ncbi:MAG TPA: ATP-grasp domain-containing protein [Candidatus Dormibacteraeota bacterium]
MAKRVLLIVPIATYRATAFLVAAERLDLEVVVGSETGSALAHLHPGHELVLDLGDPEGAAEAARLGLEAPVDAVLAVDDQGVLAAAAISRRLGLPGNAPEAVGPTRDKLALRHRLGQANVDQPRWATWREGEAPPQIRLPAVVKPRDQAASRGVIRVDGPAELDEAGERIREMLAGDPSCLRGPGGLDLLVEEYVAGPEVAVEGMLVAGRLEILAIYDKPVPLDGPFFEETVYTVPSELGKSAQDLVAESVEQVTRALGLRLGPVHAELRLGGPGPRLVDIASRTIGGRCSAVLRFRSGRSLEEIVLLNALGEDPGDLAQEAGSRGVMMLPIPRSGVLVRVPGRDLALGLPGIEGVELTIPVGGTVRPLPEGDRYLDFITASGSDQGQVIERLERAHAALGIVIGD